MTVLQMRRFRAAIAILIVLVTLGACQKQAASLQGPGDSPYIGTKGGNSAMSFDSVISAPDFPAGAQWYNTAAPLSLKDLKGKVVLLDFWTYCCINCMHIIPDLKRLEAEFPDTLAVVGVHSAKFLNEKDGDNIRSAILRYELEHPVVNDADMKIWDSYAVHSWPTVILLSPEGKVLGQTSGEGTYDAMHGVIEAAVKHYDELGKLDRTPLKLSLEKDKLPAGVLSFPGKLETDEAGGRLFISDSNHNRIIVTSLVGAVQQVIGSGVSGFKDGALDAAQFQRPQGVCYDPQLDVLYVADTENHAVRRVSLKDGTVSTVAGNGKQAKGYPPAPGIGSNVALSSPWDIVLHDGTLLVAMAGSHQIWSVDPKGGVSSPFAGTGRENIDDGPPAQASLAQTSGLSLGSDGLLYFADSETSSLRRVGFGAGAQVESLIGEGLFDFGDVDGKYPDARLQHPIGLLCHGDAVYIADTYNHKIRRYDIKSGELSSFIGTGERGLANGPADKAQLDEPNDVAYAKGKLYIADTDNNLVRVYDLASGVLGTLQLSGLEQLTGMDKGAAKAPPAPTRSVTLAGIKVAPGTQSLRLQIVLPQGTHLNPEGPSQLFASAEPASTATAGAPVFKLAEGYFEVPLTIAQNSAATTLTLDAYVFYCDVEGAGQCYFDSTRVQIPVTLDGGAGPYTVEYSVMEQ